MSFVVHLSNHSFWIKDTVYPPATPTVSKHPTSQTRNFLTRKIDELEAKFQQLGPETVAAVILEPVVGAALGCVPAVPRYLSAVRSICNKYGTLHIFSTR